MPAFKSFRSFLRSNFITGLLAAVPFALTIACLAWFWKQIDGPLSAVFHLFGVSDSKSNDGPWAKMYNGLIRSDYKDMIVPMIGFLLIVVAVTFLGLIMRSVFGRRLLQSLEGGVGRLPVVGMLYGSIKQLGDAFISKDGKSKFQRAVAVQFPHPGVWAIGFVTGPGDNVLRHITAGKNILSPVERITVFVPTSPLPSAGFMLVVPVSETMELDMSVQDALKLVVSGGMLAPIETPAHKIQSVQ
ncbi:MAG: DUF502 domain-containing protein [Planctomycetota bacterium]